MATNHPEPTLELESESEEDPYVETETGEDYDDQPSNNYQQQFDSNDGSINQNGIVFDPNGIPYEIYTSLSGADRRRLGQCQYCQKFYSRGVPDMKTNTYKGGMLTNDYDHGGEAVCFHCIFMLNYNKDYPEIRQNFDGAFGKTIVEYIIDCKDMHDKSACTHSEECFICDFLNGKEIIGIFDSETLSLFREVPEKIEPEKVDDFSFNIAI